MLKVVEYISEILNTLCVFLFKSPQVMQLKVNSSNVIPLCFRECIECRLFNSGRLADNETCQRLCKDEIITLEVLSKLTTECPRHRLTSCMLEDPSQKRENTFFLRFLYSRSSQKTIICLEGECILSHLLPSDP